MKASLEVVKILPSDLICTSTGGSGCSSGATGTIDGCPGDEGF